LLPPVFLDYYLNSQGGYDVPRLPYEGAQAVEGQLAGRTGAPSFARSRFSIRS
jgi:hypothetical protein